MLKERPQAFLALPAKAKGRSLADLLSTSLMEHEVEAISAADLGVGSGPAVEVHSALRRADVVVADITGSDPNVLFEVGLAFGMSKPVLLLSQEREVTSDLRAYDVVRYRSDKVDLVRSYITLWLRDIQEQRQESRVRTR